MIRGGGVAAHCCAGLLRQAGLAALHPPTRPSSAPAILLGAVAVKLLRDCLKAPDLLANARHVRRRIVAWGGSEPTVLPHDAVVLSGGDLHAAMEHVRTSRTGEAVLPRSFGIHTEASFPVEDMRRFGARPANAQAVTLLHAEDEDACWVEAVAQGWLFMIPSGPKAAWLLGVGAEIPDLLALSRHIAPRIERGEAVPSVRFETAPRMLTRLSGSDWLACGTDALAFDPLCGDGTAQAAREASLAAATLHAIAGTDGSEEAVRPYLDHYHSMLLAGMRRHLRQCGQFYATGADSPWWRAQLDATREGFDWCSAQLAAFPEPRYRLDGLTLTPLGSPQ
ncbi:hypothetical protein [Novosphingobium sp. MBES04]|uniref:hypothetical protein n=1 Tax=Novosphingobium sp. MBES04 TaxID=1206458 RepID=UPI0006934BEE|nr:hypothetical protein [Novosphingobium sp. MBES04]GAM06097.1 hypothetical conserved protein [Novosphingobium sp. MBES04]